jgi:NAD(P)H-flavin reductase/hemoglobin-like flavoprotein
MEARKMGLRRALSRWLGKDKPVSERSIEAADRRRPDSEFPPRAPMPLPLFEPDDDRASDLASQATTALPVLRELDAPTGPVGGGLVLGQSERRLPTVALPGFYVPPAIVAPKAPAPYSEPGLLTKYAHFDRDALSQAWELVSDRADKLITTFYAELFYRLPEAMRMFPSSMSQQRQDFGKALVQWVLADDAETMRTHLDQLGADHRKFDVEPRHYEVAGAALVSAWKTVAGPAWTPSHEAAVIGSYTRLASMMIDGAMRRLQEPASWGASIIDHHRILQDFAVVRVQPDAPYPYKAGQYLTVEIASHRKQWRQMSIASAPRADNSFDIHVRSVGGSGVSAALVAHSKVGDRITLGPPRGNDLVVEPGTVPRGLLCVASGTGAAPITAVVESILAWREPPSQLFAFVGGRTREDVYSVEQLNRLVRQSEIWSRAQVYAVVSDDPGYVGYHGRVETVVPILQDWAGLGVEVLIAGPNPMIAATVSNLTDSGVPLARIHFDQYELAA